MNIFATKTNRNARVFATLAVMLLLLSPIAILISSGSGAVAADPNPHVVEYHPDSPTLDGEYNDSFNPGIRKVTYYGDMISTEYNPQVWDYTVKWYEIKKYSVDKTVVFTGWKIADGMENGNYTLSDVTFYPGEVLTEEQIEKYTLSDNTIHVFATWGVLNAYVDAFSSANTSQFADGTIYTNFVLIHDTSQLGNLPSNCQYPFTIRSADYNYSTKTMESASSNKRVNIGEYSDLRTDTIIDSVELWMTKSNNSNHGDSLNGIFANGHTLIIGDNVSTGGSLIVSAAGTLKYPQIFGGSHSSWISSTNVIIHSGVYSNVMAGSYGSVGISGDLKLVMNGGAVLDTVVGGSSGGASSIQGSTYIYILGDAILPGDTYEENVLGSDRWKKLNDLLNITIEESSILTGGSNGNTSGSIATIAGDTHIYISGEAEVWDAQGPGRRAASQVDGTAHVCVSGKAWVKHMVAGSITDGNSWRDMSCVGGTEIIVKDDATVASVFGAGYDTWANPTNVSMMGESTTIEVNIMGGTVGYVYGGGYRGTVGTPSDPIGSITVSITGGTILGDVFGGGRGGLDKIIHTADGRFVNGSGYTNSTGSSVVYAKDVSVTVSGNAVVNGNVYGGGESTPVITGYNSMSWDNSPEGVAKVVCDNIVVSVDENSTIEGDVYGAGKGVDTNDLYGGTHSSAYIFSIKMSESGWQVVRIPWIAGETLNTVNGKYSGYASVQSRGISIDVSSKVEGSVYGAGMIGETTSNISMSLTGEIDGDVYGGGFGSQGVFSTQSESRSIVVNGANIGGSVYGGSRYGDDNHDSNLNLNLSRGAVTIYLVSGNISTGSSGNVYGGGYVGVSNLDATILVGTSSGIDPTVDYLHVRSIFGGASVGEPSENSNSQVLLQGDTRIEISNGFGSVYKGGFSISGDVFGAGDYCDIGGHSSIWIEDFSQNGNMLSIQKSDVLRIIGSEIVLDGNMDGNSTAGSEKLSLNLIGNLILQKSAERGTTLTLNAAASQIYGYSSYDVNENPGNGDSVGEVPDFASSDVTVNSIVMNEGMVFSILGTDDLGIDPGEPIQGYTLLRSDSRGYYGAIVIGVTDNVVVGETGFYVFTSNDHVLGEDIPVLAQTADYRYNRGGTNVGMTMWHLTGVYKVETTVILQDTGSGIVKAENFTVQVPKTVTGSEVWFVGGYVTQDHSGSLNLVDSLINGSPGTDFLLKVGTEKGNGYVDFGKPVIAFPADYAKAGDGVLLSMSLETNAGFISSGFAGSVTLHMVEMLGSIPINMFDVEVDIYLRVYGEEIVQTVMMRPSGTRYKGTTDAYLPVLPSNMPGLYYISNGADDGINWVGGNIPGELSVMTVGTNLNKNGWLTSDWSETALNKFPTSEPSETNPGTYLGTGGVYAPVLNFTYEADIGEDGDFEEVHLTVLIINEQTGAIDKRLSITLKPVLVHTVTVTFNDKYLEGSEGTINWTDFQQILSIELDFGTSLGDVWVAYKLPTGQASAQGYIDEFTDNLSKYMLMDDDGLITTASSESEMNNILGNRGLSSSGYTVSKVESFLEDYNETKPNTSYSGGPEGGFDYGKNDDWYDSKSCLSRFFFSSQISVDELQVYAGYTIKVTIVPFYMDDDGDPITGGLSVSPSVALQGNPGDEIDLTDMQGGLSWTAGFELYEGNVWYSSPGDDNPIPARESDRHVVISPRADYTLYLRLQVAEYEVDVVVEGGDFTEPFEFTMTVGDVESADHVALYKDSVTVMLSPDKYGQKGYHIDYVTGSTINGQISQGAFTVNGFDVSFEMPNGDLTMVIHMTNEYRVTVELASGGLTNNSSFSIGLSASDNGATVSLEPTTGASSASLLMSGGILSFPDGTGGGIGGRDITITVTDSDGNVKNIENGINLGQLTSNVTYKVYVSVEWELLFDDSGYSVTVKEMDPVTGNLSDKVTTVSDSGTVTVNRGDVLTLVPNTGYSLDGVNATGVTKSGGDYVVNGLTVDVTFTDAKPFRTLTIVVSFTTDTTVVSGSLTVDGLDLTVSKTGYKITYTAPVIDGDYTIKGGFEGFILDPVLPYDFTVTADTTIEFAATASSMVIIFHDGENKITVSWTVDDNRGFGELYKGGGGTENPAGWAGLDGIVTNETVPNTDMFTDGKLELTLIPVISDIGQGDADTMTLVILKTELTDGYTPDTSFNVSDAEIVSSELDVTVICKDGKITLKSTEGGTGTFSVFLEGEDRALILEVYVLEPVNIV